jgi:soluble lytic murein transglycosylase-like protein
MSVSVTLQKSVARGLDAVSGIMQHIVMIVGLLILLGIAGFLLAGPEENPAANAPDVVADAGSVPASEKTLKTDPGTTNAGATSPRPYFAGALEYVKRRYRVSPDAVLPVFEVADLIGRERRIDPLLILAVIGVESGFNPFAESPMGARGLMQVIPRFHMDKVPEGKSIHHLFDPAVNIHVGVRVLEEAIRRRGGLVPGLQYYAGSSDTQSRYANRVMAEKARLEKAARRAMEETVAWRD